MPGGSDTAVFENSNQSCIVDRDTIVRAVKLKLDYSGNLDWISTLKWNAEAYFRDR